MQWTRVVILVAGLGFALQANAQTQPQTQILNDYPTAARADYVYGCMKSNGETREALEKCSCSIDVIASILPYDAYVRSETALSMGQVAGEAGALFRQTAPAKQAVTDLRRAQAEAEVRCF
jgi:hypothetical protein